MPTGADGPHNSSYTDTNSDRTNYNIPQTPIWNTRNKNVHKYVLTASAKNCKLTDWDFYDTFLKCHFVFAYLVGAFNPVQHPKISQAWYRQKDLYRINWLTRTSVIALAACVQWCIRDQIFTKVGTIFTVSFDTQSKSITRHLLYFWSHASIEPVNLRWRFLLELHALASKLNLQVNLLPEAALYPCVGNGIAREYVWPPEKSVRKFNLRPLALLFGQVLSCITYRSSQAQERNQP